MSDLLSRWLDDARTLDPDDPQAILREYLKNRPDRTRYSLAWTCLCYGLRVLSNPLHGNENIRRHLVYIISGMRHYARLSRLIVKRQEFEEIILYQQVCSLYSAILHFGMATTILGVAPVSNQTVEDIIVWMKRRERILYTFQGHQVAQQLGNALHCRREPDDFDGSTLNGDTHHDDFDISDLNDDTEPDGLDDGGIHGDEEAGDYTNLEYDDMEPDDFDTNVMQYDTEPSDIDTGANAIYNTGSTVLYVSFRRVDAEPGAHTNLIYDDTELDDFDVSGTHEEDEAGDHTNPLYDDTEPDDSDSNPPDQPTEPVIQYRRPVFITLSSGRSRSYSL
ncbi:hypothetical protein V8C42DRAFT_361083 [Trichoderma barbatum]